MFDPITIAITDVTLLDEGPLVTCRWRWGSIEPQELRIQIDPALTDANDVREAVTRWVLYEAEAQYDGYPLAHTLKREPWTVEFEEDEEPFEATRTEMATIFMLRKAEEQQRLREVIIDDTNEESERDDPEVPEPRSW